MDGRWQGGVPIFRTIRSQERPFGRVAAPRMGKAASGCAARSGRGRGRGGHLAHADRRGGAVAAHLGLLRGGLGHRAEALVAGHRADAGARLRARAEGVVVADAAGVADHAGLRGLLRAAGRGLLAVVVAVVAALVVLRRALRLPAGGAGGPGGLLHRSLLVESLCGCFRYRTASRKARFRMRRTFCLANALCARTSIRPCRRLSSWGGRVA